MNEHDTPEADGEIEASYTDLFNEAIEKFRELEKLTAPLIPGNIDRIKEKNKDQVVFKYAFDSSKGLKWREIVELTQSFRLANFKLKDPNYQNDMTIFDNVLENLDQTLQNTSQAIKKANANRSGWSEKNRTVLKVSVPEEERFLKRDIRDKFHDVSNGDLDKIGKALVALKALKQTAGEEKTKVVPLNETHNNPGPNDIDKSIA